MALLRFGTSRKDIHRVDGNSHFSTEKTLWRTGYLYGRYSANGSRKGGTYICTRYSDIYLLQNLRFLINRKKSVIESCQNIKLLGMEINSIEMTLTLPQNRKGKIVQQCQDLPGRSPASIRELSQKLVALHTAIAVNNGFDYFLKRWGAFCQAHRTRGS